MRCSLTKRQLIRSLGGAVLFGSAGCAMFSDDGDLVFRNEGSSYHWVTAIMDRGSSYTPSVESANLDEGEEERLENVFPRSDWPYPFLLHVYVDGDYVRTTEHRWDQEIVVTIRTGGAVTATETDRPVDVTPQVRNHTRR